MDDRDPSSSAGCEYWKIVRRDAPPLSEPCAPTGRYIVKDFIPSVTLCHKHYAEYEASRSGTIVKLWYRTR